MFYNHVVKRNIPELAGVDYFGHTGNSGDAVAMGASISGALVWNYRSGNHPLSAVRLGWLGPSVCKVDIDKCFVQQLVFTPHLSGRFHNNNIWLSKG